jgi:pyruvate carboxylase subunit B
MRYSVNIAGRTVEVVLAGDEVTVDGKRVRTDLRTVDDSDVRHLLVDGRSYTIVARQGSAGTWEIHVDGHRMDAEVLDDRTRAIREMTGATQGPRGPKPVRAPMPGMIVRVEVGEGDTVRGGQGVVVIEAMKMENELKADGEGTVARVLVAPGQAVEKGAVLIEFLTS